MTSDSLIDAKFWGFCRGTALARRIQAMCFASWWRSEFSAARLVGCVTLSGLTTASSCLHPLRPPPIEVKEPTRAYNELLQLKATLGCGQYNCMKLSSGGSSCRENRQDLLSEGNKVRGWELCASERTPAFEKWLLVVLCMRYNYTFKARYIKCYVTNCLCYLNVAKMQDVQCRNMVFGK